MNAVFRKVILICVLGLLMARGDAFGESLSGDWRGSYFFTRIVAQLEQADTNVWGIVSVHKFFGGVDTYHFTGSVDGVSVRGSHHQGTKFEGELVSSNRVVGVATTRRGRKLRIKLKKRP